MALPLSHLKVLDVSQVMAGPFCCMLLGDMGADVIKVEPPGGGDQSRKRDGLSRSRATTAAASSALNRNKRSVALNLKSPAGREVFYAARCAAPTSWSRTTGRASRRASKIDYATLARDQSAPRLCQHLGLRPDRSVVGTARLRPDRAGDDAAS